MKGIRKLSYAQKMNNLCIMYSCEYINVSRSQASKKDSAVHLVATSGHILFVYFQLISIGAATYFKNNTGIPFPWMMIQQQIQTSEQDCVGKISSVLA